MRGIYLIDFDGDLTFLNNGRIEISQTGKDAVSQGINLSPIGQLNIETTSETIPGNFVSIPAFRQTPVLTVNDTSPQKNNSGGFTSNRLLKSQQDYTRYQ